jgi:hypothetical protein
MRNRARTLSRIIITAGAIVLAAGVASAAKPVEQLTAFAVDMSNMAGRTRTGTVDIIIDRWSTDAERDRLVAALREGGPDALLKALQKADDLGRIRSTGSVGYPLRFAREIPISTGGRRIILATDRPISFFELTNQPRTTEYPFLIVDIRMSAKGEGEGKLLPLAKVTMNEDHVIEVENYASEPVRLSSVRKVK